jgi:transcriptional regulator with XRE-family HTH domain
LKSGLLGKGRERIATMTKPIDRARGLRLKVARLALGISDVEAAAACGVSLKTYSGYERGLPQRWSITLKFAREFNVSIDWLVLGNAANIGIHLAERSAGPVAILPAGSGSGAIASAVR